MRSEPSLITLPVAILDAVLTELPLLDMCSLRLTARVLAVNIAHTTRFASYFHSRSLVLSKENLKTFAQVVKQAWLSSALQHLTIIGLVPGEEDSISDTGQSESLELLKCAFSHMPRQSSNQLLRSLTLDVKSQVDGVPTSNRYATNWHAIWKCARDTAWLVTEAARASMVRFERLDVYSTTDRCALSLPELKYVLEHIDIQVIKALALTVSSSDTDSNPSLAQCMVYMLESAELLEDLELRWFNLCVVNASATQLVDRNFFDSIASLSMPRLKRLSLRGVRTSEKALLTFLTAHSELVDLTLEEIHLTQGRFLAIFAHLDDDMTMLDSLYLNDLWETKLIQFPGSKGEPHFHSLRSRAPSWMRRTKEDRLKRKRIRYREQPDRQVGSPAFILWLRKRALQYGPVESNHI